MNWRKTSGARFAARALVALAPLACGCRVTPYCQCPGAKPCLYELSYLLDYSVPNYVTFPWSDDFLLADSDEYRQELAGPLSALAASTYGGPCGMDVRSLERMGFPASRMMRRYGRDVNYRDPALGKDQVGFTFAVKDAAFADGTRAQVVMVLIRGTFGRDEWISNLNVCNAWGRAPEPFDLAMPHFHQGFSRAADGVMAAFKSFVAREGVDLGSAKIAVTGHSRGAAVANLVGARLCENRRIPHRNLFVYTYATPNTVIRASPEGSGPDYWNVFNVLNPEDAVPLVPLEVWKCHRYGRDLHLKDFNSMGGFPCALFDATYIRMKDEFRKMTGVEYWHTPFGTTSTRFVPRAFEAFAPEIPDLYAMPDDQRADGNLTCFQGVLESLMYRNMRTAEENERISLGDDIARLSEVYSKLDAGVMKSIATKFILPDGRNTSGPQPGWLDLPWRFACMHATQTYIGWMKAAEFYGPKAVYQDL